MMNNSSISTFSTQQRRISTINEPPPLNCQIRYFKANEKIGEGAQSQIYKGYIDDGLNTEVAIKIYKTPIKEVELKALLLLKRKFFYHLIKIIDQVLEYDGTNKIIMEIGKYNLEQYMQKQEYINKNKQEKNKLFLQIVKGVQELHAQRFFHCDIKPSNIICFESKEEIGKMILKICDFGCVQEINSNLKISNTGTEKYSPLDQKSQFYDQSVDIWALGINWCQMKSQNTIKIKQMTKQKDVDDALFQQLNQIMTKKEIFLLQQMLQLDPKNRISIQNLTQQLEELINSDYLQPSTISLAPTQPPPMKSQKIHNPKDLLEKIILEVQRNLNFKIQADHWTKMISIMNSNNDTQFLKSFYNEIKKHLAQLLQNQKKYTEYFDQPPKDDLQKQYQKFSENLLEIKQIKELLIKCKVEISKKQENNQKKYNAVHLVYHQPQNIIFDTSQSKNISEVNRSLIFFQLRYIKGIIGMKNISNVKIVELIKQFQTQFNQEIQSIEDKLFSWQIYLNYNQFDLDKERSQYNSNISSLEDIQGSIDDHYNQFDQISLLEKKQNLEKFFQSYQQLTLYDCQNYVCKLIKFRIINLYIKIFHIQFLSERLKLKQNRNFNYSGLLKLNDTQKTYVNFLKNNFYQKNEILNQIKIDEEFSEQQFILIISFLKTQLESRFTWSQEHDR